MLAACGVEGVTAAPGPRSFTSVLVASLCDLAQETDGAPFSTWQLLQHINLRRSARHQSFLLNRMQNFDRHISLSPLPLRGTKRRNPFDEGNNSTCAVTLRFSFGCSGLTPGAINELATHIPKALRSAKAPLKKIECLAFETESAVLLNASVACIVVLAVVRFLRLIRKTPKPPNNL